MTARQELPATPDAAAPALGLRVALRSITGPHRASNQDSAGVGEGFAFVADGVGGHAGGDVASRAVSEVLIAGLTGRDLHDVDDDALQGLVADANEELAQRARDPRLTGMATTFTGLFCGADAVRVAHIGDSRAYLVRDGAGTRVTHDDSYVQLLVDSGLLEPEDAWLHPQRNLILQSLAGAADDATHLAVLHQDCREGDRWLLCSDGLTDYLLEDEVLDLLRSDPDVEAVADALVAAALDADTHDNVTVVVCDVVADWEPVETRVVGAADPDWVEPPVDTVAMPEADEPDEADEADAEPTDESGVTDESTETDETDPD
ncbi:protein phosphatase 2C domain-containing protein [Actinotalea sp. M2MS4P-6]|uniref:PP2C family protein-serine/threonine phosphatase n=1 Tax=Actinotalea sp. M2MS4P-6 TaxID=2983762 RepID=UPI0021E4F8CC|nr:protein phosphatase 2C domain-containing protein [Actinotalea sp. M2MS4P-6]MCV2393558.1 protein phosphatase 2C domain-containing protein [Actinotalea sp. M2MS4P-6]